VRVNETKKGNPLDREKRSKLDQPDPPPPKLLETKPPTKEYT